MTMQILPKVYPDPHSLLGSEGTLLGPSGWLVIDQSRVDGFAEVTGDHQWIHTDVERAKTSAFGGTIAHGYLSLSLVNYFLPQILEVRGFAHAVNVGVDKLRFLSPVRVGSYLCARGEIISVAEVKGAVQSIVRVTLDIGESRGKMQSSLSIAERPALVVDTISRYYPES